MFVDSEIIWSLKVFLFFYRISDVTIMVVDVTTVVADVTIVVVDVATVVVDLI